MRYTQELLRIDLSRLTKGQMRAVEAVVLHGSNKAGAYALGIAVKTIESHMCHATRVSGARTRTLLLLAVMRKIVLEEAAQLATQLAEESNEHK